MGIKGLFKIIESKAPECKQTGSLTLLRGKLVAIDMGWFGVASYSRAILSVIGDEILIKDPEPRSILRPWILETIEKLKRFLDAGIIPVLVWDGPASKNKAKTHEERKEVEDRKRNKLEHLREQYSETKHGSYVDKITAQAKQMRFYDSSTKLEYEKVMSSLGFPSLKSITEADHLCCALTGKMDNLGRIIERGVCQAVHSTDGDMLTHGATVLITDIDFSRKKITLYSKRNVLEGLGCDSKLFEEICICLGCDYNDNMPSIGPKRVMDLFEWYGSIDKFPATYGKDGKPGKIQIDTSYLKIKNCQEEFEYKDWKEFFNAEDQASNTRNFKLEWNSDIPNLLSQYNITLDFKHYENLFEKINKLS